MNKEMSRIFGLFGATATLLPITFLLLPQWKTVESWGVPLAILTASIIAEIFIGIGIALTYGFKRRSLSEESPMHLVIFFWVTLITVGAMIIGFRIDQTSYHCFAIAILAAIVSATVIVTTTTIVFLAIMVLHWIVDKILYDPQDPQSHC